MSTQRRRGSLAQRARTAPARTAPPPAAAVPRARFGPSDDSRSVRSPWVWRGFAAMALVALGLLLTFALDGRTGFAVAWAVIFVAWGGVAALLFRRHVRIT
jgi:hypothetical protein